VRLAHNRSSRRCCRGPTGRPATGPSDLLVAIEIKPHTAALSAAHATPTYSVVGSEGQRGYSLLAKCDTESGTARSRPKQSSMSLISPHDRCVE